MNNKYDNDKTVFTITNEDIQQEAIRLVGRQLTDYELIDAADALEWGLSTGIDIVLDTAIKQAVEINDKQ